LTLNEYIRNECSIGVIYNDQTQSDAIQKDEANIKRGTIDKFIGQENDLIVMVVATNRDCQQLDVANVGISSSIPLDFRRSDTVLNWALTRARLGLFLVIEDDGCIGSREGSNDQPELPSRIDSCKSWRELMKYYGTNGLIVE
jgi:superfamily I DNA and/or RNA helicase